MLLRDVPADMPPTSMKVVRVIAGIHAHQHVLSGHKYQAVKDPVEYGRRAGSHVLFNSQGVHKSMPAQEGGDYVKWTFFFAQDDAPPVRGRVAL